MNRRLLLFWSTCCALCCCAACDLREVDRSSMVDSHTLGHAATAQGMVSPEPPSITFPTRREVPVYSRDVEPLFDRYCMKCHDRAAARGGVVLEDLLDEILDKEHQSLLIRVADNLRSESMPPEGEPRPVAGESELLNDWLDTAIATVRRDAGSVHLRRLNRAEYNNTIRDLIGIDLRPAADFPSDDIGYGFDNIGEVLSTPPMLVEMYLSAADKVISVAFQHSEAIGRILNPPADAFPLAFRKYRAPVRTPPGQGPPDRAARRRSRTEAATAALRYPAGFCRPRLQAASNP